MEDIKKLLSNNKLYVGTEVTLKELKKGNVSKVLLSSNAPESIKDDLKHYKELTEFEVEDTKRTNEDIGALCKKPFNVSVLGIKK